MEQKYEAEKLEAQKRFDALPENLKKEILADKNVGLISAVCQDYGLPENKVKNVALVAGEVFLGYLKPGEIASELNQFFEIDLQKSNFIEIELKQKLFDPLKADLEKIYNPPEIPAEKTEEPAPAIIKIEPFDQTRGKKEAAPLVDQQPTTNDQRPQQRISPLMVGAIPPQPPKVEAVSAIPQKEPAAAETPFIIQTKAEAVKPAAPQFPKGAPSLNLKAEPSLIKKTPVVKPISVRLELEKEQPETVKFKMPVVTDQRPTTNDKQLTTKIDNRQPTTPPQQKAEIKPFPEKPIAAQPEKPAALQLPRIEIKPPIQQKPVATQPIVPAPEKLAAQKPITELKESKPPQEQPPKFVHYSNFKTPLTPAGVPKKPEPKKEDRIDLATFTKVSGNTIDLRSTTNNPRLTTNDKE